MVKLQCFTDRGGIHRLVLIAKLDTHRWFFNMRYFNYGREYPLHGKYRTVSTEVMRQYLLSTDIPVIFNNL